MAARYWWEDENDRPLRAIDSRSHEGIAYMNWCLRQKPADLQPNAVERLLARAEQVVELFDAMFGPVVCAADPLEAAHLHELVARYAFADVFAPNERTDGPPRYRDVLTDERLGLMKRWESDGAVHLAVERTIAVHASKGKRHGHGHDFSPEAIAAYCEILAARETLLNEKHWLDLEACVVQESSAWGLHACRVAELARAVRVAVNQLRGLAPKPYARRMMVRESRDAWHAAKAPLRAAIADLTPFATPPAPTAAPADPSPPAAPSVRDPGNPVPTAPVRDKRSTGKGEAKAKLIAALAAHHKYSDGSCAHLEPVKNNALARLADVDQGSASYFFRKYFRGHRQYIRDCQNPGKLSRILGSLVGDIAGWKLFGRAPESEGGRAEDE